MAGRLSCVPASLLFLARGEQGCDSGTAPQSLTERGESVGGRGGTGEGEAIGRRSGAPE